MKSEAEIRQMIETLKGTLRHQADPDSVAALGALLWAVGDYPSWTAAHTQAAFVSRGDKIATREE